VDVFQSESRTASADAFTVPKNHRLDYSARDVPTGGDKVSVAGNVPCQPADLDVSKLWAAREFVILDDSKNR